MNHETLQNAIDQGGYIELPAGKHRFDEPFAIPSDKHIHIDGRRCEVEFALPKDRALFELRRKRAWGQGRFWIENLVAEQADGDTRRNSVIAPAGSLVQVDTMQVKNCQFRSNRGYCIDMRNTGYCVAPVIRDLRTVGAGSIRWTGHREWDFPDALHATSQLTIENVRHLGGSRIGPAFRFRGCSGLRMRQIIDEGSCNVATHKKGQGFALGLHIESPRTPCVVDGYWFEAGKGTFSEDAPKHWMFTFEADGTQSTGKHNYIQIRIEAMKTSAFNIEGPKVKLLGGGKGAGHSLWVDILDAWQPERGEYSVEGKARLRFVRPLHATGTRHRGIEREFMVEEPINFHTSAFPYIGTDEPDPRDSDAWLRG